VAQPEGQGVVVSVLPAEAARIEARAPRGGFLRALLSRPVAAVAIVIFAVIVLAVILAPLVAPYSPNHADLANSLAPPSGAHLLGTDQLGRDTFSRLLYGGRPSLLYTLEAWAVAMAVGLSLGILAGFAGGWVDRSLMQLVDIGLSVPVIVIVLIVISLFTSDFWLAMAALGLLLAPPIVRNVRGPVYAVRHELFVDAARVSGIAPWRIALRHIFPRVRGPILVQATLLAALALLFTTGLGFLGFGVSPPNPSWGNMTAQASQTLGQSPWLLIASGGIVAVCIVCLGLIGDSVRDVSVEPWSGAAPAPPRRRRLAAEPAGPPGQDAGTPAASDALLSIRGLTVAFPGRGGDVVVARDVGLEIAPGEAVGLLGESGSGKTTVARSIVRLLRDGGQVAGGSIVFGGRDVLALSGEDLRRFRGGEVSVIAQEPQAALDPACRVGSILREAIRGHQRVSRADARARAIELLRAVRLPDPEHVARLYPHELSGGMAQRVAIARALAGDPRLLIADEPTTALDVTLQAEILSLLRTLQRERGMALLLVSHDLGVIADMCQRTVVMYAGEVVERAAADDLFQRPAHPYSQRLLLSDPSRVSDDNQPLPVIPGAPPAATAWPTGCHFQSRCPFATSACRLGPIPLAEPRPDHFSRCVRIGELLDQKALTVGASR
jgi:peptide/nickel transport system permease protein